MSYTEVTLEAERLAYLTGERKGDWISWLPEGWESNDES